MTDELRTCLDPDCACHSPQHYCKKPHNGEFNVGDSWECPECGLVFRGLTKEQWMKVTHLGRKYVDALPEPIWTSEMGLTA